MRAEEFFAFTATRPDDEKWELIEGEPVLNASASFLHQIIASNLIVSLADLPGKLMQVGRSCLALASASRR